MKKTKKEILRIIFIDVVVLTILLINLLWIIFDGLFAFEPVNSFFKNNIFHFYNYYNEIHHNFWLYDLYFVIFYFTEIFFQWIMSIKHKTYEKWYYYPIMHWYDVLGSIPVGNLVWLRLLRVISIIVRLSKLELIDISKNIIYRQLNRLLNIISEEISDRVVVNILSGVQSEIANGNPVFDRINKQIIAPRKENLIQLTSSKIKEILEEFTERFDNELKEYIDIKVKSAVEKSKDVKKLTLIPVVGTGIRNTLQSAISDIVHQIVIDILNDLKQEDNTQEIREIITLIFDALLNQQDENSSTEIIKNSLIESLEIIKDQVKIQQWKVNELSIKKQNIIANMEKLSFDEKMKRLKDIEKIEKEIKKAKIKLRLFKIDGDYSYINEKEQNEQS